MRKQLLLFFLFISLASYSQKAKILYERKLELGLNDKILVEHHLSVHPSNSSHLLLSGMYADKKDSSVYGCFSVVSTDNGKSWGHLKMFSEPEGADPWADILPDGRAVFAVLGIKNLFVFHSADAGLSWSRDSVSLGSAFDHQTFVTDNAQGIIYITAIKGNDIYSCITKIDFFFLPTAWP